MQSRRSIMLAAVVLIATAWTSVPAGTPQAQLSGVTRKDLQRHDLSARGREVIQARIDIAAGMGSARHKHPGEEIIYVLEGQLEYLVAGKSPVTLKRGDVLFIPAETVHSARNVGRVNGAELATYVVEKGKPLIVVAEGKP